MNINKLIPIAIFLAAGLFFYFNLTPPLPDGYVDLSAVELQAKLENNKNVIILDVRSPAEFKTGRIAKAQNKDYHSGCFDSCLNAYPRQSQLVVYCATGDRSASTLKKLNDMGFTKVWHLPGGMEEWQSANLPIER